MVIFARNVPSEAGLDCPLCDKKYKVRTTKKHVKDVHSKSLLYKCVSLIHFDFQNRLQK